MHEVFGTTDEGETIHRVTLRGGGLTANIITWGTVVQDLRLEGHKPPLVLGFDTFDPYPKYSPYFGSIAGRVANRIRNGRFELDGKTYQVNRNVDSVHTLHGGENGIGRRVWEIADLAESSVTLTLLDPDGAMGFPGNVQHTCRYELTDNGTLSVDMSAETDAPTPLNLAHHSYFNLDGSPDCLDHVLQIDAQHFTPLAGDTIPTGEIHPVENTPYDFRRAKSIRRDLKDGVVMDRNFCLANEQRPLTFAAKAWSERSGVTMAVFTTEPGLQFYAGHKVETPVPGLTGELYAPYCGFALETQNWPNAINEPDFPNSVLRPGETLRQLTEYRFSRKA